MSASLSPVDETAVAAGHRALARHAKSFSFAALFLPRPAADDAAVLYAFCREVDDAVDEAPSLEQARAEGARLAAELAGAAPARPSIRDLQALAARRAIDLRFAHDLIEGVRADAAARVRLPDDEALLRYGYQVAGTVGGMMAPILGVTDPRALRHAVDLGIAMQLTNICRDVLEDARRDRVYLPALRLRDAGLDDGWAERIAAGHAPPREARRAITMVVRDLLALAERYYASADAGMRFIPARARLAILVASRVYRAIGVRLLRHHGADALHGRTVVPLSGKLAAAARALVAFVRLGAARDEACLRIDGVSASAARIGEGGVLQLDLQLRPGERGQP
jgi:15-cis-phytoene synthase